MYEPVTMMTSLISDVSLVLWGSATAETLATRLAANRARRMLDLRLEFMGPPYRLVPD